MCGICGFVGNGNIDILSSMNEMIVHRGPDAGGLWYDASEAVYLGNRRLSIIDLSGGAQPMWTKDGDLGIVFNGEIYNHLELRDALIRDGHNFISDHSDTEVLLHGYRQWGKDLAVHISTACGHSPFTTGKVGNSSLAGTVSERSLYFIPCRTGHLSLRPS